MAKFEEVYESNQDALSGIENFQGNFSTISGELEKLGYEVLINNKEKQEFIPGGRLSSVVAEREQLKEKLTAQTKTLGELSKGAEGNADLQAQFKVLTDQNDKLMSDLRGVEEQRLLAKEFDVDLATGVSVGDILAFVNKDSVKVKDDGSVLGAKEELARLKTEKPFLFGTGSKGGSERGGGSGGSEGDLSMNDFIRGAAK